MIQHLHTPLVCAGHSYSSVQYSNVMCIAWVHLYQAWIHTESPPKKNHSNLWREFPGGWAPWRRPNLYLVGCPGNRVACFLNIVSPGCVHACVRACVFVRAR